MRSIIESDYHDMELAFRDAKIRPMCGWGWLRRNRRKIYLEQRMTILYDGKAVCTIVNSEKVTKKFMKTIVDNCKR